MKIISATLTRGLRAVFLLALFLVAARPLAAQSNATIRVGVYNFEPLIFVDQSGAPKGIYLDVLESIAAREKWQIEYVPGTWQECLTRLETGAIDLLPSIGYTEERAQKLDFTNEYLFLDWGLVYRGKGKPIHTVLDLDGKKIAALKGSVYTLGLAKLLDQFDLDSQIVEKNEYTEVLAAVERGQVDAGIITKVYGLVLERNYPQIEATEIFFAPVKIFFAVPKGQHAAIRATLDREIAALKVDKNSIYHSSLNKWIGLYQAKEVLPPQVIVGFTGTLALLALFFGFTLILRQQVAERTRSLEQEIHERKQTEENLRAREKLLQTIAANYPHSYVSIIERDMTVGFIAGQEFQKQNLDPEQFVGLTLEQVFGEHTPVVRARYANTFAGEEQSFELFINDQHQLYHSVPLRAEDGTIPRILAVVENITERKRAEDDIRQLNAQLEQRVVERTAELNARVDQVEQLNRALANLNDALKAKNRELETFTYSVSHDLKAPLRGIDGYSRLLLDDYADKLDDDGRAFLQTIRRATDQMARLIDDLLAYSRVERRALTTGVVQLQVLVDALIIERADDFKRRNVALNVALACNAISTSADGLTLILRNLLDNALKFTRDVAAPQIEIGGRDEANVCVLWVRDNGIGFEMKYYDRLFEIFQRLHRAEDYPGTGIGLAIVRKALERIGGRVWAESAPGQGATFFVEIPR